LLVNLHWRSRRTGHRPLGGFLSKILLCAAALFLLAGALSGLLPRIGRGVVGPFSISCDPALLTPGRPLLAPIMVQYPSKYGSTISPVHLMISVTLVNLQPEPSTIDGYSLEWSVKKNGPWLPMKPISTTSTHVFWAFDLKSSVALDMSTNGLDFELGGRQLNSHETVRGWTLWECLDPSGCSYTFVRFSVRDTAGMQGFATCRPTSSSLKPEAEPNMSYWKFLPGRFDLSNAHRVFSSECCP
jgi:hypothetical protein